MEIYQLKSFLTIAHKQNLTRAAGVLNLSQSALSSQIKALEEELGLELFQRTSRGMLLTEHGNTLLTYAREVVDAAGQMQQKAVALNRGMTTSVSIGLNTDPTLLQVSAINQRLAQLHDDLNVIFHACQSSDTMQNLLQGKIDLGFFYGNTQQPGIEQCLLTTIRICVAIPVKLIPNEQGLDWPQIAAMPWIWVNDNFLFFKVLQETTKDFTTMPNKAVTAADEQTVRELVLAGQGVAIMREDEARPLAENGQIKIWNRGWGDVPLSLAWPNGSRNEKRILAARETIQYLWRKTHELDDGSLTDKCWV